MSFKEQAIYNTHSDVISINAETDAYDKDGNILTLDLDKVTTEQARLQTEYDAQPYSRNREAEYPSVQECVHAILDNDNNELDTLQAKRAEIKLKYPKGG